jgi:hypothetical protein
MVLLRQSSLLMCRNDRADAQRACVRYSTVVTMKADDMSAFSRIV